MFMIIKNYYLQIKSQLNMQHLQESSLETNYSNFYKIICVFQLVMNLLISDIVKINSLNVLSLKVEIF